MVRAGFDNRWGVKYYAAFWGSTPERFLREHKDMPVHLDGAVSALWVGLFNVLRSRPCRSQKSSFYQGGSSQYERSVPARSPSCSDLLRVSLDS